MTSSAEVKFAELVGAPWINGAESLVQYSLHTHYVSVSIPGINMYQINRKCCSSKAYMLVKKKLYRNTYHNK